MIKQSTCQQYLDQLKILKQSLLNYESLLTIKDTSIKDLQNEVIELGVKIDKLEKQCKVYDKEIESYEKQLNENKPKEYEIKQYWDNKIPTNDKYTYPARSSLKDNKPLKVDPRIFLNPIDNRIPRTTRGTNDEKAYKCLKYVFHRVQYTSDMKQFKSIEEWLFAWETFSLRKGDCEDGAILLANMMIKSGIPSWRVRLNAGDVKGGGHCWVTYLRESDNQWVILDWCYWYKDAIKGLLWKDAEKYYDIWFSFNQEHIYMKDKLDR